MINGIGVLATCIHARSPEGVELGVVSYQVVADEQQDNYPRRSEEGRSNLA